MSKLILGREFEEGVYYMNTALNPHYNSNDEGNKAAIEKARNYDAAFINQDTEALEAFEKEALGGKTGYKKGVKVNSPWGDNTVLDAKTEDGVDTVIKEITVKPGFMLSLQRHRGRQELWGVQSGTLTVISDGVRHEITAGNSISLPKGNVHCMINAHNEPVTVIETQTGFCREADNERLVDFNNRPTIPLLTQSEGLSAILYAEIHSEIQAKFGCENKPKSALMTPEYKKSISELKPTAA
jgi:mannose-6-phosphate isomerase-like protein (cupin superfamily)